MLLDAVRAVPLDQRFDVFPIISQMLFQSQHFKLSEGRVPCSLQEIYRGSNPTQISLPASPIAIEDDQSCVILANYDSSIPPPKGLRVMRYWIHLHRPKGADLRVLGRAMPSLKGATSGSITFEFGVSKWVDYASTDSGPVRSGDGILALFALSDPVQNQWTIPPEREMRPWCNQIGLGQAVNAIMTAIEQIAFFKLLS